MATITNQNEKLPVYTLEIILQQLLEFSENRALTVLNMLVNTQGRRVKFRCDFYTAQFFAMFVNDKGLPRNDVTF